MSGSDYELTCTTPPPQEFSAQSLSSFRLARLAAALSDPEADLDDDRVSGLLAEIASVAVARLQRRGWDAGLHLPPQLGTLAQGVE